jgi:hypothetical protein
MPIQLVNAGAVRALDTVHQLVKPLGSSLGARYEVVARVDSVIAAHR